jgi:hypothetical protein
MKLEIYYKATTILQQLYYLSKIINFSFYFFKIKKLLFYCVNNNKYSYTNTHTTRLILAFMKNHSFIQL